MFMSYVTQNCIMDEFLKCNLFKTLEIKGYLLYFMYYVMYYVKSFYNVKSHVWFAVSIRLVSWID